MKDSDLIVCAKIGASMRHAIVHRVKAAVEVALDRYRDAAMLVMNPSPENAEMVMQMIRDQLTKALEDSVRQLKPELFLLGSAKCPAEMLASDVAFGR